MSVKESEPKDIVNEWWRKQVLEALTRELLWRKTLEYYGVTAPKPWYRRLYNWMHWRTIGRFRAWLHRDCGDY